MIISVGGIELQAIMSRMRGAIERYRMLAPGDRIAVGVSGGKDSMLLLYGLHLLSAYYPAPFSLVGITLDPCFDGVPTDYGPVRDFCRRHGIEYMVKPTNIGQTIFRDREEPNPCSLCARLRRGMLHNGAKAAGCNKVALGHHADDAAETLFMNLLYGGCIGCFSPVTYLDRKDLTVIRPLIFLEEHAVMSAVRRIGIPVVKSRCPVDGDTARARVKAELCRLDKEYGRLRTKTLGALQRSGINGWAPRKTERSKRYSPSQPQREEKP